MRARAAARGDGEGVRARGDTARAPEQASARRRYFANAPVKHRRGPHLVPRADFIALALALTPPAPTLFCACSSRLRCPRHGGRRERQVSRGPAAGRAGAAGVRLSRRVRRHHGQRVSAQHVCAARPPRLLACARAHIFVRMRTACAHPPRTPRGTRRHDRAWSARHEVPQGLAPPGCLNRTEQNRAAQGTAGPGRTRQ